jgi:hypothetical protein
MVSSVMFTLIQLPFFTVALHESGTMYQKSFIRLPVYKAHTNNQYIFWQYTYIVYITMSIINNHRQTMSNQQLYFLLWITFPKYNGPPYYCVQHITVSNILLCPTYYCVQYINNKSKKFQYRSQPNLFNRNNMAKEVILI